MEKNLNRQIVEQLLDYIRIHHLAENDPLPSENVLLGELKVSRVILREALSSLKALGLLTSRRGSGYRVQKPSLSSAMSGVLHALTRSGLSDLDELYALRRILESGAIADAVNNANDDDRQAVRQALAALESFDAVNDNTALRDFTLAEIKFHQALLKPASCQLLDLVNQSLEDFFTRRNELADNNIRLTREQVLATNLAHRALADAFLLGNAQAAMFFLRSHLQ